MLGCPIVYEGSLKAGFNPSDPGLVNVGFFLFPKTTFYVQVVKFLPINEGNAQLLFMSCID